MVLFSFAEKKINSQVGAREAMAMQSEQAASDFLVYEPLAVAMASNSICHSLPPDQFRNTCARLLNDLLPERQPQPRIVVVVGAGASNAACALPVGRDAANYLRQVVSQRVGRDLVDPEIERLALQHNLKDDDFETILLALSKFDRPLVLKELQAIFGRRHHPWLGYELLAHFLKHRFIDAIVNFNFDEILDQAISDELGEGDYYKVVLDGDCPTNPSEWFEDHKHKFRLPLYIKPHGSASQPSSMRFTRDSYTTLPESIVALLSKLFSHDRPLYLLVLGHAMQSIEFNHILKRVAEGRSDEAGIMIFFVKPEDPALMRFADDIQSSKPRPVYPKAKIPIDAALKAIWDAVEEKFARDADAAPRSVTRHDLISKIFSYRTIEKWTLSSTPREQEEKTKRLMTYFKNRTYIEIALAVAKAKGYASLEDLAASRVGTYFRLYRERQLMPGGHDESPVRSIGAACAELNLHPDGYGGPVVVLDPPHTATHRARRAKGTRSGHRNVIVSERAFITAVPRLAKNVLDRIDSGNRSIGAKSKDIENALLEMYRGEEVEVSAKRGGERTLLLKNAEVLPTLTALKLRTQEIIVDKANSWDCIVCTAKSGQWLLSPNYVEKIKKNHGRLALVVADTSYVPRLKKEYERHLVANIRWLPWWLHNRHVTVFLKAGHPEFALSFERRMRMASIAPLYLDGDDVRSAWDTFVAYWLRANRFRLNLADDYISAPQLEDARKALVAQLRRPVARKRQKKERPSRRKRRG